MGIALHMSKTQILALVFFIVSLIVISLVMLHAVAPGLWHTLFPFGSDKLGTVGNHY
jgi:hypothetical protein